MYENFQIGPTDTEIREQFGSRSQADLVECLVGFVGIFRLLIENHKYQRAAEKLASELIKNSPSDGAQRIDLNIKVMPESVVENFEVHEYAEEGESSAGRKRRSAS
jgi:hypothetical protein